MLRHCSNSSSQHRHHQSVAATAPASMASASTTFSLFFPLPDTKQPYQCAPADHGFDDDSHSSVTTSPSSPSSSAGSVVDCTLSLGTPSSRRAAAADTAKQRPCPASSCGAVSWDVAADHQSYCFCCCCQGGSRPSPAAAAAAVNKSAVAPCAGHGNGQQDPMLVDRRCNNCGTSSTPLWRNGPRGPKSLCNACGIRFKKEERRAAATATATATAAAAAMDQQGGCGYFAQRAQYGGGCEAPVFPCGGGGDVADAEAAVPPQFLAWRFDVVAPAQAAAATFGAVWPDRTTMFQYN